MLAQYGNGAGVTNKFYDAKSLFDAMEKRAKQYEDFEGQLRDLKKEFQGIVYLDDEFKGKGAEAIKDFYRAQIDVVDAWLRLAKRQIAFFRSVQGKAERLKLSGNTVVHVDFLGNELFNADRKSRDIVETQKEDLQKIFDGISDIVDLKIFSIEDFEKEMNHAEKKRTETIENVNLLDHELVKEYEESEHEEQYARKLYEEVINATRHGGTVSPINFDADAYHSSEVYQMIETEEKRTAEYLEKKEEEAKVRELEKKAEAFLQFGPKVLKAKLNFTRGIGEGIFDAAKDTVTGIWELISHPKESAYNIYNAARHPWPVIKHIAKGIADSFEKQVIHGNAETRGKWIGYALTTIATSVVGTKGVDKAGKVAEVGAKAGTAAAKNAATRTAAKVNEAVNRMNVGPQLQIVDGYGKIPFNVLNPVHVKDQLLKIVSGERPLQKHHYATNKSKKFTPKIEHITKKYGLDLDDDWNKELLPHLGRHPNEYHEFILSEIKQYDQIARGNQEIFLKLYEELKDKVRNNPDMLYKDYWRGSQ